MVGPGRITESVPGHPDLSRPGSGDIGDDNAPNPREASRGVDVEIVGGRDHELDIGEVPFDQVSDLVVGRFGGRGDHPPSPAIANDVMLGHHPRHPLVIDPLLRGHTVIELGCDPRCTTGAVLIVNLADTLCQNSIKLLTSRPGAGGFRSGIERRTRDLEEFAQPLHRVGVEVVGDELEAAHQFVSPAKNLAA